MTQIGLDFGSSQIKAVESKVEKKKSELLSYAKIPTKGLNLLSENKDDLKENIKFLTDFVLENGYLGKYTNISLGEHLIYSTIITLPDLKGKELENAIKIEMEQNSYIPLSDASKTYQILPKVNPNQKEVNVLAVIAPNSLTTKIHKICQSAGLRVNAIEPESLCTIRSLIDEENEDNPPTLIVNIGHKTSDICIYSDFSLRFTRSVSTGFLSMQKALSQDLELELIQAEEYIKTYGFNAEKLNGKIKASITPIYSIILNEIKRAITYFESRPYGSPIKRVILVGGGSLLPGMVVYTTNFLGVEVQLGDSFRRYTSLGKYKNKQNELDDIGPLFSTAVGASLKGI